MAQRVLTFQAKLFRPEGTGTATFLRIPEKVMRVFATKTRVPVTGTINGVPFRSSLSPMGGAHLMPVNAQLRTAASVSAGDRVTVVLERDMVPRVVEVPAELASAFRAAPKALSFFEGLSYTHQKEYVLWISEAKRDETRRRRIKIAVEQLAKGVHAK
jgi:hypothetical protein